MKTAVIVLAAVLSVAHGYSVNSHQGAEEQRYEPSQAMSEIKAKGWEIVSRAARELFRTVLEEKSKSQASWVELYENAVPEVRGRALNPMGSTGMNALFGVGSVLLGLASLGLGGSNVARSLKSAYDGIEWRSGIVALTREDFIERAFDWMDVKDVACKKRMICEVEQYAADQSTIKTLILKFLSKRHPALQTYSDAVDSGLDYYDCAEAYPECPMNSLQLLGNVPLDRFGINTDYLSSIPWATLAEHFQVLRNAVV